jgi:hypothetical protein
LERTLANFVRALRMADVRVSTAETLDAFRAAEMIGWQDRQRFKDALGAVLSKSADEHTAFDACFDQFFHFDDFETGGATQPLTDEHNDDAPEAANGTQPSGDAAAPGEGESESQGGGGGNNRDDDGDATEAAASANPPVSTSSRSEVISAPASPLGRMLMADDRTALSMAISRAARDNRIEEIKVFTQQGLYTRRIMDDMGRSELMDEILSLESASAPPDQRLAGELRQRHDRLRAQIRDHVESQFLLHADAQGERLREDMLRTARLANVSRRNDPLMRRAIERMARQLVAAHTRKRRVTKRGRLDVPRMIRKNMRHNANMVELAWQSKRIEKPKVFAICDVSGSVALYARFMLMFLYSLKDVLPQVRAFAFCSDLAEVTDLFQQHDLDEAIRRTLAEHGQGSSDYGHALADFEQLALQDIDRSTTVLILGDARNNEGNPRTDLLRKIFERSRRVIWLNPEPKVSWDTGDSVIGRYRAHCHQTKECGSLKQLERVVSDLLRSVT